MRVIKIAGLPNGIFHSVEMRVCRIGATIAALFAYTIFDSCTVFFVFLLLGT